MSNMTGITRASELFDLTGQVALVTGASAGLGARFAQVLAAHGARVALAARRVERIEDLAARLPGAMAVALDVTDPAAHVAALVAVESRLGPLTLLVNNAGVAGSGRVMETTAETWRNVQATNVDAVFSLSQAFAHRLIAAERPGTIINIASIASFTVSETPAAYAVSKAAVAQLTRAMARELARHRIRVNAIAPGYIQSEMTADYLASPAGEALRKKVPQRRFGEPADLDGLLLLLASPRASGFMTGSIVTVDGGLMLA
jgi:NAD(P)-dependent dehydrogenase (short-subunit alcohol dehydrogenase family)